MKQERNTNTMKGKNMENSVEDFNTWGINKSGGKRTYNVGRITDRGVEVYQVYPPLNMAEAVEIKEAMQRLGAGTYGIFNVETYQ